MRNVLLVDDESIDLLWLEKLITDKARTVRVTGKVHNGRAALQMLQTENIEIVVTDIRMPVMSGIEFAVQAKEIQPDIRIVFVSGHQEFEYAKEAIRLHAAGYLLKPVDDAELIDLLESISAELDESERELLLLKQSMNAANQELLAEWLTGDNSNDTAERALDLLDHYRSPIHTLSLLEAEGVPGSGKVIRQVLEAASAVWEEAPLLPIDASKLVLLAGGSPEALEERLEQFIDLVKREFGVSLTIGMSEEVHDKTCLPAAYQQALGALELKWTLGKDRVIRDASQSGVSAVPEYDLDEVSKQIFQAMLRYDLVAIDDQLNTIFNALHAGTGRKDVYALVNMLTSKLHVEMVQINEDLYQLLQRGDRSLDALFVAETMQEAHSWLRRRLFELSEILVIRQHSQSRKLIENIKRFVADTIETRMTLKEVAEHFNFSPNHLGFLFKKETGKTFTDFLIEERIRHACKLLQDPNVLVYEVSEKVGYKNTLSFNQKFKQLMGMSPSSYRKSHHI